MRRRAQGTQVSSPHKRQGHPSLPSTQGHRDPALGLVQSRWPGHVHRLNELAEAKLHPANTKQFRAFWEVTQRRCGNEFSCWSLTIQVFAVVSPRDRRYLPGCAGREETLGSLRMWAFACQKTALSLFSPLLGVSEQVGRWNVKALISCSGKD